MTEAAENLVKIVAELGHTGEGTDVCDIGCGYGLLVRFLCEHGYASVEGIELDPRLCACARACACPAPGCPGRSDYRRSSSSSTRAASGNVRASSAASASAA